LKQLTREKQKGFSSDLPLYNSINTNCEKSEDFKKNKQKRKLDTPFSQVPLNHSVSNISNKNTTGN